MTRSVARRRSSPPATRPIGSARRSPRCAAPSRRRRSGSPTTPPSDGTAEAGDGGGRAGGQPRSPARQGRQRRPRRPRRRSAPSRRRRWSCSATATSGASAARLAPLVEAVERGECDLAVAAFARRVGGGFGLALGFARWAIRRLCGAETEAPISGQRALRAEALRATLPVRARLRDGDRDDRRRGPRRLPAAASTSSTSSTGRPGDARRLPATAAAQLLRLRPRLRLAPLGLVA